MAAGEWVTYRRMPDRPVEVMQAHFERHVYHLHSHETYSFGLTRFGAQSFDCRGASRVSAAGMVMAFNPDEPHDGHSTTELGFTYSIVHIGTELITDLLTEQSARPTGLPLFADPVLDDPLLSRALSRLHASLWQPGSELVADEALGATVAALVRRGARRPLVRSGTGGGGVGVDIARRVRAVLDDRYLEPLSMDDLAEATECSRFALYRAFRANYGLAPSDYQRLLRLRAARRSIAAGRPVAAAAVAAGFADQAHLTRWFRRCYGITPGVYLSAAS
ncbi:AraC family transcriptional regulator [Nocardia brasiliensis]|uniref:AraC family transcriptional regulator n=1 Tax=Nocardia brasiliensis (strain ATCC 700358 / HUJEG-1) TaxID=1133849 RepID=K0EYX8_NOCB7|nr:AraC family transcriptional regulator [Nocardia brasiliensis]AFU05158.1 AraC family transcriptional regulator [Nocardia brasiliensis ATCC 700358]